MQKHRNAHTHTHTHTHYLYYIHSLLPIHQNIHSHTHTHAQLQICTHIFAMCSDQQVYLLWKAKVKQDRVWSPNGDGQPKCTKLWALTRVKFCADSTKVQWMRLNSVHSTKVQWMRLKITYTHSRSCSLCQSLMDLLYILDYIEYKHRLWYYVTFSKSLVRPILEYGNAVWAL